MAIETTCPDCGEEYNFPDRREGEKTRCSNCDTSFVIGEESQSRSRARSGVQSGRGSAGPQKKWSGGRSRDDDDDDDDRPRRGSRKVSSGEGNFFQDNLAAILIIGSVLLLLVAGLVTWLVLSSGDEDARPGNNQHAHLNPNPDGDPFGNPPRPDDNHNPRPEQPRIGDVDTDSLIAKLQNQPGQQNVPWGHGEVLAELGRRKDPRAIPAIASQLTNFFERGNAENALRQYGRAAEKEVLPYFHHADQGTRGHARNLLRDFRTSTDTLITQTLSELNSNEVQRRQSAATWLADTPPDPARAADVARAQVKALTDDDGHVREHAIRGLKSWGSKENTPALVKLLEDLRKEAFMTNSHRYSFEALAKWKDPRGVPAVAHYVGNFFISGDAEKTLRDMGPVATKELLPSMNDPNWDKAQKVRGIIKAHNPAEEVLVTQCLADLKDADGARRRHAAKWLSEAKPLESKRADVARALEPLLKDPDGNTHNEGVKALKVWYHKDNLPYLVGILSDKSLGGNGRGLRAVAMDLLAEIKDEKSAEAVLPWIAEFFERGHVVRTLKAMGPAAETAVGQCLIDPNPAFRIEGCRILQEIGTEKSMAALQKLTRDQNRGVALAATQTIEAIKKRQ